MDAFILFWPGFLSALAVSAFCGVLGVYVVLHRAVFLTMALAQFAACGVALALLMEWDPSVLALTFVLGGMVLTGILRNRASLKADAWLGGLTAAASAASILIIASSAYGLDEVKNLLFAEMLLLKKTDLLVLGSLGACVVGISAACHRRFLLSSFDPDQARADGLRPGRWLLLLDGLIAVAVALAIRAVGSLVVFGLLVLPAMAALGSARRMKGVPAWSAGIAVLGTAAGLWLSIVWDRPAGPCVIASVAVLSLLVGGIRRCRCLLGGPALSIDPRSRPE